MKKTTKHLIALTAAVLALFGCNNNNSAEGYTDTGSIVEETPQEIAYNTYSGGDSNQTYIVSMDITLPEKDNDEVVEAIRSQLLGIMDAPSASTDPQAIVNRKVQQKKIELTEMSSELTSFLDDEENYRPQLVFQMQLSHMSTNKYFMTFVLHGYEYGGGAHGGSGLSYLVFDMSTGKQISEKDITTNKSAITNLLRTTALREYKRNNPEFEVFEVDNITANGNFFITPDSLIYQYGEYEIAAYCFGRPTFRLNKKEVKPYINPESAVYKYWFGEN
ncbi:MAG: DUF3298 domain-containing protein [Bacteroidales bacterium]|nr:DUF3298 domain-containing protein [Bacteroidales bacterium]